MGEFYNPYPKLPKNIRQMGERDLNVKLYVEDYVNTYLKRLYPTGGQELRVGLLVGEVRTQEGTPYLFADGALEMENVVLPGGKVEFTEEAWERAYRAMDQMFPKRTVLGWFLCSAPDRTLSPLNYWKQHSRYFPEKNQLMYLSCGLEGEEAVYMASEDGFYRLRGYCIYYERNQMMQDYMVSRKDAHRVEAGTRDAVIRDFRQRMEDNQEEARRRRSTLGGLQTACGVLTVMVLACGVAMFNNYQRMREMEAVLTSALPEEMEQKWSDFLGKEEPDGSEKSTVFEEIPGEVYPTRADIRIEPESMPSGGQNSEKLAENGKVQESPLPGEAMGGQAGEPDMGGMPGVPGVNDNADAQAVSGTGEQAGAGAEGQKMSGESGETGSGSDTGLESGVSEQEEGMEANDAQPVQVPADALVHVVEDGETLYGICLKYYHSVNNLPRILEWNHLSDENRLSVGQELFLPPV